MREVEGNSGKKWEEMSPDEKREFRINKVLSPPGPIQGNAEAEDRYRKRAQRVADAYLLKTPDRVPVRLIGGGFFPAYFYGCSGKELVYDAEKAKAAIAKTYQEFDADLLGAGIPVPGKALEMLQFNLYKWPGYGLNDEVLAHQYEEGEYMLPDEYEALIDDPTDFWIRTFLPRIFGGLQSMEGLFRITDIYEVPTRNIMALSKPEVQETLRLLLDVGEELGRFQETMKEIGKTTVQLGFPGFIGGFAKAPFDIIGDTLRGTRGILLDMFRRPDQLLEAMERLVPITIKSAVEAANASGKPAVSMPLHKGADGFMSQEQFETFYWPTLKKVILGIREEGVLATLFAEGTYDSRLETIAELPEGTASWLFDLTDMNKAKEILGGKACIEGNVPAALLTTGNPDDVTAYCRDLIGTCGKGGGFILSPGASAEKAKPENLKAMAEAAKEYGTGL